MSYYSTLRIPGAAPMPLQLPVQQGVSGEAAGAVIMPFLFGAWIALSGGMYLTLAAVHATNKAMGYPTITKDPPGFGTLAICIALPPALLYLLGPKQPKRCCATCSC